MCGAYLALNTKLKVDRFVDFLIIIILIIFENKILLTIGNINGILLLDCLEVKMKIKSRICILAILFVLLGACCGFLIWDLTKTESYVVSVKYNAKSERTDNITYNEAKGFSVYNVERSGYDYIGLNYDGDIYQYDNESKDYVSGENKLSDVIKTNPKAEVVAVWDCKCTTLKLYCDCETKNGLAMRYQEGNEIKDCLWEDLQIDFDDEDGYALEDNIFELFVNSKLAGKQLYKVVNTQQNVYENVEFAAEYNASVNVVYSKEDKDSGMYTNYSINCSRFYQFTFRDLINVVFSDEHLVGESFDIDNVEKGVFSEGEFDYIGGLYSMNDKFSVSFVFE